MRLLFTADLHIKLRQKNIPYEWSRNRFFMFLDQLAEMQNNADKLIIGGDIFDTIPNMEEIGLYISLVSSIKIPCIIYSGNHEAVKRHTTFLTHLKEATSKINPLVEIVDDFYGDKDLYIIPYNRLKWDKYPITSGKILCTHVRGEVPPHIKPEIDLELLDGWQVVLAGDLHNYNNCQRNILYPGSPYTTSFHRELTETGAIILDTDTLKHEWINFNLPQLLRKSVSVEDERPTDNFHHVVYEVVGNMSDLANIDTSETVSKKAINKGSDAQLILDPNLTLEQEVMEYLEFILFLGKEDIVKVLNELNSAKGELDL